MIPATGKKITVKGDKITIGEETLKIKAGEVYVLVTADGVKVQKQYVHRINEKPCDMGTLTSVKIALLAVGPQKKTVTRKKAVKKDGE